MYENLEDPKHPGATLLSPSTLPRQRLLKLKNLVSYYEIDLMEKQHRCFLFSLLGTQRFYSNQTAVAANDWYLAYQRYRVECPCVTRIRAATVLWPRAIYRDATVCFSFFFFCCAGVCFSVCFFFFFV